MMGWITMRSVRRWYDPSGLGCRREGLAVDNDQHQPDLTEFAILSYLGFAAPLWSPATTTTTTTTTATTTARPPLLLWLLLLTPLLLKQQTALLKPQAQTAV